MRSRITVRCSSGRGGLGEQSGTPGVHPRAVNSMLDEALRAVHRPAADVSSGSNTGTAPCDPAASGSARCWRPRTARFLARDGTAAPPDIRLRLAVEVGRWATSRVSTSRGSCWRGCWTRRHSGAVRPVPPEGGESVNTASWCPARCGRTCSAVTTEARALDDFVDCGRAQSSGRRRGRASRVRFPRSGGAHRRSGTPRSPERSDQPGGT